MNTPVSHSNLSHTMTYYVVRLFRAVLVLCFAFCPVQVEEIAHSQSVGVTVFWRRMVCSRCYWLVVIRWFPWSLSIGEWYWKMWLSNSSYTKHTINAHFKIVYLDEENEFGDSDTRFCISSTCSITFYYQSSMYGECCRSILQHEHEY